MAAQFVPVELDNVERGKFIADCEKAFAQLQQDFVAHVDQHDVSAVASLNMAGKIGHDKARKAFAIVTDVAAKLPKKPSGVTTAFIAEDAEGVRTLFTQSAGTGKGNPRQGILEDVDGGHVT